MNKYKIQIKKSKPSRKIKDEGKFQESKQSIKSKKKKNEVKRADKKDKRKQCKPSCPDIAAR